MQLTDVAYYEEDCYLLITDDHVIDQLMTIDFSNPIPNHPWLRRGIGALLILSDELHTGGYVRVTVEIGQDRLPDPRPDLGLCDEWDYPTELGSQRVRQSELDELFGELSDPITPPGPARVHVRMYKMPGPHKPYTPEHRVVDAHIFLQIWNKSEAP